MGQLLAYSLTSAILLACLYLVYKWILSSENYHKVNRLVIWSIYLAALGLPSFWKAIHGIFAATSAPAAVTIDVEAIAVVGMIVDEPSSTAIWLQAAICLYVAGMAVVSALTLVNFGRLYGIIRRGDKIRVDGKTVVLTEDDGIAPFSFCKTIVVPRKDFRQYGPMIMLHEKSHVEFHHWIDLLFAQGVCILQWFNPAAWLLREEMKAIHEYQADDRVITAGVNVKEYQMLLIKKAVGARFPSLANSLNHSKLQKRITMMYQSKSRTACKLGSLVLVPALAIGIAVVSIPAVASVISGASETTLLDSDSKVSKISANTESVAEMRTSAPASYNKVFTTVEKPAEFPGGIEAMMKWLQYNVKYPKEAEKAGEQGKAVVKFTVNKDGSISNATIIKSVSPSIDKEALRVVTSMPKWKPAENGGKKVACWFTLPVSFRLAPDKVTTKK